MGPLRATWRASAILLGTLVLWCLWMAGQLVAVPLGRSEAWRSFMVRVWARGSLWTVGARARVHGRAPAAPFFLVSNHLSYVDILLLGSHADCVFVAKSEIARWPLVGMLAKTTGTLFVDRAKKRDAVRVGEAIEASLQRGRGVVLFAEGTSTGGAEVLPFRAPLLEPAARVGLAVDHAAITYRTLPGSPPARQAVCWWGDMGFVGHFFRLLALPGFEAELTFGEERTSSPDRKLLAERLHAAVRSRFHPVDTPPTPSLGTSLELECQAACTSR